MKYLFLIAILFAGQWQVLAQQKTNKPATTSVPKFILKWGNRSGGEISAAQVQQLVDSPLVALDEKGKRYVVAGFSINYTFKASYKDEESGQLKQVKDFRSNDFDNTDRLTDLWRDSVKDNAKKEDEILFNKVRVKLPNGKLMAGPDLRFSVK